MSELQPTSHPGSSFGEEGSGGKAEILRPAQIFDPVARALDVIGDRWSLVLVRQLLARPKGFQELRVRTGIAPKVLSSRLRQLRSDGFVETEPQGNRSIYRATEKGRSLEPIISSIARWWVREGITALDFDATRFTEPSALSVLEALPNLLREALSRTARIVFEIRLSGQGGGVWTVEIKDGRCEIRPEFAERADVRYTASARDWCAVALGVLDAKEAVKSGRLHKEGGPQAMDEFFHQIARSEPRSTSRSISRSTSRTTPKQEGETP